VLLSPPLQSTTRGWRFGNGVQWVVRRGGQGDSLMSSGCVGSHRSKSRARPGGWHWVGWWGLPAPVQWCICTSCIDRSPAVGWFASKTVPTARAGCKVGKWQACSRTINVGVWRCATSVKPRRASPELRLRCAPCSLRVLCSAVVVCTVSWTDLSLLCGHIYGKPCTTTQHVCGLVTCQNTAG
jgi:hypothetical protein